MTYNILRWDSVEQNNKIVPMIYFKPDLNIVNLMKLNNNKIKIQVCNTNYYNNTYNGVINQSSMIPNCRPNFYDASNLYVIILDTDFITYPTKMGEFTIYDPSTPLSTSTSTPQTTCGQPRPTSTPKQPSKIPSRRIPTRAPSFQQKSPQGSDGLNGLEIGLIIALIFLLLLLIFGGGWAYQTIKNKRKKK
ncbi:hypothetical protein OAK19_04555 [Aureispira]|nr:hypothetical protein [Aureispira sp.]